MNPRDLLQQRKTQGSTAVTTAVGAVPGARVDAAMQGRYERLLLLHDVAKQFVSSLDLSELMSTVFARIQGLLEAQAGSMWILDDNKGDLVCEVAAGPEKDKITGLRIPVGSGIVGWVVQKHRSTIVYDATKDKRFSKAADRRTGFETKSMITVPLVVGEEALGAIQVLNKNRPGAKFTDDDLELMEDLASYAAISIKNARLYQSQQRIKELDAILGISKEITSTLDLDHVLVTAVNMMGDVVEYERCAIAMESGGHARVAAISGQEDVDETSEEVKRLAAVMGWCLDREKELYVPERETYAESPSAAGPVVEYMRKEQVESFWAVPLMDEEGKLGVLMMESSQADFIKKDKFEILPILSSQLTVTLRNAQLYGSTAFTGLADRVRRQKQRFNNLPVWGRVAVVLAAAAAVVLVAVPLPASVSADFELKPARVRKFNAPLEEVLDRLSVREDDIVKKGDVIGYFEKGTLETKLQQQKLRLDELKRKLSEATQGGDTSKIAQAQNDLFKAEQEKKSTEVDIEKVTLRSPFSGKVITPDLQDIEGKKLKEGDEILEIAQLDRLRVEIAVPEEDIRFVEKSAAVTFLAAGFRDKKFHDLEVERIAPRATDKGGKTVFIVSANCENERLAGKPGGPWVLRPGMTGRASISTKPRSLVMRFLHWMGLV